MARLGARVWRFLRWLMAVFGGLRILLPGLASAVLLSGFCLGLIRYPWM